MFLHKLMYEMEKNIKDRKNFCFGRIFGTADRLLQIQKKKKPIREMSFMKKSVVFTFPYQANGTHATKPSTVSHIKLRMILERYFWFHWNCKQLWVRLRNSMPNSKIYFPIFPNLKLYIQIWEYFHNNVLGSVGRSYCKKLSVGIFGWNFWLGCLSTFKCFK